MLLPQTAEYALRALACFVGLEDEQALRSSDIAERSGVPAAYLQKVLRRLVEAGLLDSQKGHGGGFRLVRKPAEIRFSDVLEATEFEVDPLSCAFGWERCDTAKPCPLHPAYAELKEAFRAWAAKTTLQDVRPLARTSRLRARAAAGRRR